MTDRQNMQSRYTQLKELLRSYQSAVLGFSGGVDSSLLAYSLKASGIPYVCVTVCTPLQKERERVQSASFCSEYDIVYDSMELDVLQIDEVRENPRDRCYYCKKNIFGLLQEYAKAKGYAVVMDGSNTDDLSQYRPGLKAKDELGIRSPLTDLGFSKREIRELSGFLGLKSRNLPSSPCLATRIPYGNELDKTALLAVDRAEEILLDKGMTDVRVRVHGDLARIEARDVDSAFLLLNKATIEEVKACGFRFVCLDLCGYKRGCYD